jgi:hypothetical protein
MENDQLKSQDKMTSEVNHDTVNVHKLIEFLEYEEAYTEDRQTKTRITLLLKQLGIWN